MVVPAFMCGISVSFASCLLKLYSKVPSLGCCHVLVMEDSLLRKGLLSSPPLAIFKDLSHLKGYLMKLSHLHLLTFDPKENSLQQKQQVSCIIGQRVLTCIRTQTQTGRDGERHSMARESCPLLQNGLFSLGALHVCKQNCRALPLKSKPVLSSVLCFLYKMFTTCLFLLFHLAQVNSCLSSNH